jgi:hypothetical protein
MGIFNSKDNIDDTISSIKSTKITETPDLEPPDK